MGYQKKKIEIMDTKRVSKRLKRSYQQQFKKIKYLTLFVFSTENWRRLLKEVNYLFSLLNSFIDKEINNILKKYQDQSHRRYKAIPKSIKKKIKK